jgi:glycosyltransferase involved in cell wall biosynthesis
MAHRVKVLGHTTRVRELLAGLDLLVSPVRYESYGLNVQEAICRGVPAIVSRSAGVAERYPPALADLLLEDPTDPRALVEKLLAWQSAGGAWRTRVEPLARELTGYSWQDMAAAFVDAASISRGRPAAIDARAS